MGGTVGARDIRSWVALEDEGRGGGGGSKFSGSGVQVVESLSYTWC